MCGRRGRVAVDVKVDTQIVSHMLNSAKKLTVSDGPAKTKCAQAHSEDSQRCWQSRHERDRVMLTIISTVVQSCQQQPHQSGLSELTTRALERLIRADHHTTIEIIQLKDKKL